MKNSSPTIPGENVSSPRPTSGSSPDAGNPIGSTIHLVCRLAEDFNDLLQGLTCANGVSA